MIVKQVCLPTDPQELAAYVAACDADLEARMDTVAERTAIVDGLKLLGLTGPSCAGKTTAAKKLTACLEAHGHRVHVISIDDFYYDKDYLHSRADADPDIEIDYDSEDTIDVTLLREKTASLLAERPTQMPKFDFPTGMRVEGETVIPKKDDVFLFEGIQILYPKVRAILGAAPYRGIYISPATALQVGEHLFEPNDIRLLRRLVRDYRYRASNPSFTFYLWQSVRKNEESNIFPNAHTCHECIDSTMPYEIGMLKPYLENILPLVTPSDPFYQKAQEILAQLSNNPAVPSDLMTQNSLYKEFI